MSVNDCELPLNRVTTRCLQTRCLLCVAVLC